MVTLVGIQAGFGDALKDLVELDYDVVDAYEAAIERVSDKGYKTRLETFKDDHERHLRVISDVLKRHGEVAPSGPGLGKHWVTKSKVVLANIMGDIAILKAIRSNEMDANTAYERLYVREDIWDDAKDVIKTSLGDVRRHKAWFERVTTAE